VAGLLVVGATIGCWTPEWLLWRLADLAGSISYRVSGSRRRDQARRNLRRIVEWMAANEVGPETYRRAASNDRALEAVVRSLFRHHIRYYLEETRAPRVNSRFFDERVFVETPETVVAAFAGPRPMVMLALHFGPVELPAFYAANRLGRVVAPMETMTNPGIQRYLVRSRSTVGLDLIPMEEAAAGMPAALRRGDTVGMIADRDLTGGGIEVQLFGATMKIPFGPVLLGLQAGVPVYVCGMRRGTRGRYRANLYRVPEPEGPSKRERLHAMAQVEASLFEKVIIDAPDQWLAALHPIWPDLEEAARGEAARGEAAATGKVEGTGG
jgi:KDO2-lipid IV(A) lauroyltransferase